MNVLLTGGAGFIGSHIGDMLIEEGHSVTVLDDLSSGKECNIPPGADFVKMDIRDKAVSKLWEEKKFDILVHLAAQMDVRRSVDDPVFDSNVNIGGTINLLEAGRENGLTKVVFTSTGGAGYDDNVPFPTPETSPARPVSPYGISKISTELYLRFYRKQYGISYIALRLANVFGPRQNPHGEAGVVAIFTKRMLTGEKAIIHGDGLQTRDYVYCKDVSRAVKLALSYDKSDSFNIGTSKETNVVEIFHAVRKAADSDMEELHGPAMPGEVRRSVLDCSLAEKELNWKPLISMEQGMEETVEFFRRQLEDENAR